MKFEIKNRFTDAVQFTAEINCADDTATSLKTGLAIQWGIENGADLRGVWLGGASLNAAYLNGADLSRAYLSRAYLSAADLSAADLHGANLYGAALHGANLRSANLYGANLGNADLSAADLHGANLHGANLGGANLYGANLGGANLRGADLGGANLGGTNLGGADLGDQWIISGPCRADGYFFFMQKLTGDTEPMIKAGCRYFTIPQAREHWQKTRAGTPLGDETFAILDFLERIAVIRGLIERAPS